MNTVSFSMSKEGYIRYLKTLFNQFFHKSFNGKVEFIIITTKNTVPELLTEIVTERKIVIKKWDKIHILKTKELSYGKNEELRFQAEETINGDDLATTFYYEGELDLINKKGVMDVSRKNPYLN